MGIASVHAVTPNREQLAATLQNLRDDHLPREVFRLTQDIAHPPLNDWTDADLIEWGRKVHAAINATLESE